MKRITGTGLTVLAAILIGLLAVPFAAVAYQEFSYVSAEPDTHYSRDGDGDEYLTRFVMPSDEYDPLRIIRFHGGSTSTDPDSVQFVMRACENGAPTSKELLTPPELVYPRQPCADCGYGWTMSTDRVCVSIAPGDTFFVGVRFLGASSNVKVGSIYSEGATTDYWYDKSATTFYVNTDGHYFIEAVACKRGDADTSGTVTSADKDTIYASMNNGEPAFPSALGEYVRDVDGDGVIDSTDADRVQAILDGKVAFFDVRVPAEYKAGQTDYWDSHRRNAVAKRLDAKKCSAAGNKLIEPLVMDWCDSIGTVKYGLYRIVSDGRGVALVAVPDTAVPLQGQAPYTIATVDSIVKECVDNVTDSEWDAVWGWLVWSEA